MKGRSQKVALQGPRDIVISPGFFFGRLESMKLIEWPDDPARSDLWVSEIGAVRGSFLRVVIPQAP